MKFSINTILFLIVATSIAAASVRDADGNKDGKVDGLDYLIWSENFGKQTTAGTTEGDYNLDGKVDGQDYNIWQGYFGQSYDPTVDPDPIPDPTSPTIYVSTHGSDNGSGSKDAPYRSIQKAIDVAKPGDFIEVAGGSYSSVIFRTSGTTDKPITLSSAPNEKVEIVGGTRGIHIQDVSYIVVNGITTRGAIREGVFVQSATGITLGDITSYQNGRRGITFNFCHYIIVKDSTAYENGIDGLYVRECSNGDFTRVVCNNNGTGDNQNGILIQNSQDLSLTECHAWNNGEDGIDLGGYQSYQGDMKNVVLTSCVAGSNNDQGFAVSGISSSNFDTYNITWNNCRSIDNDDDGVHVYEGAHNITFVGCEFSNNLNPWYIFGGAHDVTMDRCTWNGRGKPANSDSSINFLIK